jgi:hypothetical protein
MVASLLWSNAVQAAPFIPKSETEVLERLPIARNPAARELRTLREQLAQTPDNLQLATHAAKRYIELGRAESDPRYYSYAQAALSPWWDQAQPPPEVLVLRATLRQNRHDFAGALEDLSQVLKAQPQNSQAWLTRAVILAVRGDAVGAQRSCLALLRLVNALVTTACISNAASLSGQAEKGYSLLRQTLQGNPSASAQEQLWALTLLAEIAARLGLDREAEQYFTQALNLGLRDTYLLGAFADFLLDQDRPKEVQALLQDDTRPDGLLLRLALAEKRLAAPTLEDRIANLQARFAASRNRGDTVHQREEARFYLHLLNQPQEALRLAQANWSVQREPWDARLLLEAAWQAGDPAAARAVLDWLASAKLEDIQLQRLVKQLEDRRS